MNRAILNALSFALLFVGIANLAAQSCASIQESYSSSDYRGTSPLVSEQARGKRLDNDLKQAQTYFAKRLANEKGKADVKLEIMNQNLALAKASTEYHAARCQAAIADQIVHAEHRQALEKFALEQRKQNQVQVNLRRPIQWPVALRHKSLIDARLHLTDVVQRSERFTALGSAGQLDLTRELTAELYAKLRDLRQSNSVSFYDVVEAKRFLNGIVAAVENEFAASETAHLAIAE